MIFDADAFDFDGSLANYFFLSLVKKNITLANRELLDRLGLSPNPKIILFGTNRQGIKDDYSNSFDNEIKPLIFEYPPIEGKGKEPDAEFRQTVKDMAAVTLEKMARKGLESTATGALRGICNYAEAQQYNFSVSPVKCVDYYKPGMIPLAPCPPISKKSAKNLADTSKSPLSKFIKKCTKASKSKEYFAENTELNLDSSFSCLSFNPEPSTSNSLTPYFADPIPASSSSSSSTSISSSSYLFFPGEKNNMKPSKGSMMGGHKKQVVEKAQNPENPLEDTKSPLHSSSSYQY